MTRTSSQIGLTNEIGNQINPSTEDKQDAVISNQTNGTQKTQIVNGTGNVVAVKYNINTTNNELLVNLEGHQCLQNTATTLLGADEVFTGSGWQDTLDYGVLSVNVSADQASATDGLEVQWSNDGITACEYDKFTILADATKTFTFGPAERYYRIVYTNGPIAQTRFNLTSLLRRCYVKPSSHRTSDAIVGEDDAELVKATITGEDDNGVFQNVKTDFDKLLRVNAPPYTYSIAKGAIAGHDSLLKFGTRTAILAAIQSTVWEGPTDRYIYMDTAQQLKISSTSANDTVGGTGIRTLTLEGLDANLNRISETVNMAGLTIVTTANSYLRIYRAYGTTCGTTYANEGLITVTNNAGTTTQLVITIGDSQTLMTTWTVPAGKDAYIIGMEASTNSNKGARISLFTRQLDGGILYPWRIRNRSYLFSGSEQFRFQVPIKISEKTDIETRFNTPTSAGTTSGGATFELWYEDN